MFLFSEHNHAICIESYIKISFIQSLCFRTFMLIFCNASPERTPGAHSWSTMHEPKGCVRVEQAEKATHFVRSRDQNSEQLRSLIALKNKHIAVSSSKKRKHTLQHKVRGVQGNVCNANGEFLSRNRFPGSLRNQLIPSKILSIYSLQK